MSTKPKKLPDGSPCTKLECNTVFRIWENPILPVLFHGLERGHLVEVDHLVLLDARVVVVSAQIRSAHVVPQTVVVVVRIDGNPLRQRVNVG